MFIPTFPPSPPEQAQLPAASALQGVQTGVKTSWQWRGMHACILTWVCLKIGGGSVSKRCPFPRKQKQHMEATKPWLAIKRVSCGTHPALPQGFRFFSPPPPAPGIFVSRQARTGTWSTTGSSAPPSPAWSAGSRCWSRRPPPRGRPRWRARRTAESGKRKRPPQPRKPPAPSKMEWGRGEFWRSPVASLHQSEAAEAEAEPCSDAGLAGLSPGFRFPSASFFFLMFFWSRSTS